MDLGSAGVERHRFDVKRKGYDAAEVTVYLHRVAAAMRELEAAAGEAELRAGRLERDLHDLQEVYENGFHQLVATNALTQMGAARGQEPTTAETLDAERIVAAASDHAARMQRQAESALADVLATTATIEADQQRLLAEAKADREAILAAAHSGSDQIIATATETAAATRADAQRFAEELRELTAAETIELVTYAKAMAASILEAAGRGEIALSVEDDDLTIDLRRQAPDVEPVDKPTPSQIEDQLIEDQPEGLGGIRPSRYAARSAHLPQIGDEQAASTIDSIEALRDR
jgi:DivIVA domain-containing protein